MLHKYAVAFDFTSDRRGDLLPTVWPETLGKRIIKAELGLEPVVDNGGGDVRYATDDPVIMLELMKLAQQFSAGGWWCSEPMPADKPVFHFSMRGGKYGNCPDFVPKEG
jgi:hypothetical protein